MASLQGSLVPETLRDMMADEQFQATQKALKAKGQLALTKEERKQRQRALDALGVPAFQSFVLDGKNLMRRPTQVLQIYQGVV